MVISNLGSYRTPAPVHWNKRMLLMVRVLMSQCTLCLKALRTKIWDRSISCSSWFYEKMTHKPSLCKQIYSTSFNSDQSPELPVLLPELNTLFSSSLTAPVVLFLTSKEKTSPEINKLKILKTHLKLIFKQSSVCI